MEEASKELRDENDQLRQFIFELLDPDTPEEYKDVIRHEVFGTQINYHIKPEQ